MPKHFNGKLQSKLFSLFSLMDTAPSFDLLAAETSLLFSTFPTLTSLESQTFLAKQPLLERLRLLILAPFCEGDVWLSWQWRLWTSMSFWFSMGKTCGHAFYIHRIMFESSFFFFRFVFCSAKFKIFSDSKSFKYICYYKYIAFSVIFFFPMIKKC